MSDASVTQESIDRLNKAWTQLREQMSQVIVGQDEVIDQERVSTLTLRNLFDCLANHTSCVSGIFYHQNFNRDKVFGRMF